MLDFAIFLFIVISAVKLITKRMDERLPDPRNTKGNMCNGNGRSRVRDRWHDDSLASRSHAVEEPHPQDEPFALAPPPFFTAENIALLEWRRFEQVVAECIRRHGYDARLTPLGPDGGVDVEIWQTADGGGAALAGIVQVKAWRQAVGVESVRALYGELARRSVPQAYFFSASDYSLDAREFARSIGGSYQLFDGAQCAAFFNGLPDAARRELLALAFAPGYGTPTCPSCGLKMVLRQSKNGSPRPPFWGCPAYPRCRGLIKARAGAAAESAMARA